MVDDIKVTLETLYDVLRNEKKKEDLQKIEKTFHIDVVSYLREKQSLLNEKKESTEIFAAGERDKLDYELRSINRILKEIYEKREKKIIDIALNRSKTGSDIIDTSAMLREEKDFYQQLLNHLDTYRQGVLFTVLKGELPLIGTVASATPSSTSKPVFQSSLKVVERKKIGGGSLDSKNEEETKDETKDETRVEKTDSDASDSDDFSNSRNAGVQTTADKTKIRFIRPMPSFVWKDMKVYGPFDAGDEIDIFPQVADLIVRKGRAEKVG